MIRHLELLERYLTVEFDREKAKKHMYHIYARYLIVLELMIFLGVTPVAFIASSGCLLWLVLTSIHILPRWKECGLKIWKFFLPVLPMTAVTVLSLAFIGKPIENMADNIAVIAKNPITVILLIALGTAAYVLHNGESAQYPDTTTKKRIAEAGLVLYIMVFAIDNPLRTLIVGWL